MLLHKSKKDKHNLNLDLNSVISATFYNKTNNITLQLDGIKCEYDHFGEKIRIIQKSNKSYLGLISLQHYNLNIKERTLVLKSKK